MSEAERESRRARLAALRAQGIDPFPARVAPHRPIAEVRAAHEGADEAALAAARPEAAVCGRVLSLRSFGKLRFFDLVADGARLQASARKGETDESVLARLDAVDVGDFVRVEGTLWRTRTGELTVAVRGVDVLAKSLRPLPEKWHGLADVEARFRQRYLDLLVNEDARRVALTRSRTVSALRRFLDERGFLEVETPVLHPVYGGGAAQPFTTQYDKYDQAVYLRISDELYLKRLVIGGLDRVYEIGRDFRNEGVSRKHNPEFTMMECYQAYADYRGMMELTEAMLSSVVQAVHGAPRLVYQGVEIDFTPPYPRRSMRDAILETSGIDILAASSNEALVGAIRAKGLAVAAGPTWARTVDELFSAQVEPTLVQPTFVTDHPLELSPLAKKSAADPRLVERFECFVAGMELANAFSELNDPDDQRARFEAARAEAARGDADAHPMDEDFLRALEHGMPPTGGLGVGVDRLAMVLADVHHIREILLFPHMRPEQG